MTFEFFLPQNGTLKNIHLSLTDPQQKKTLYFRTSLRIPYEDWEKEKQRPSNIYKKEYKKLNSKLNTIKLQLTEQILEKRSQKRIPSQRTLAKEIRKICNNLKTELPENSLLHYMQLYLKSRKELICHSTYKRYKVFYRLIERFEGFMMKRLYIDMVNGDFIRDFLVFGKEEEYSENTVYRTIHFIKTILNFAERKGVRTAVRELQIRREKQQKDVITLTEQEIILIKATEVPKTLQPAKDWLLISCYTGQRFSDFMQFNIEQLQYVHGKTCLAFTQQKTGKEILLPLHPTVLNTIKRNGNKFPKPLSIQHYNKDIKEIGKLASLRKIIRARKRIGHRTRYIHAEKWEMLSSHVGRRSFATNFYGKIPTPLLMEATGHTTEQMFLKYINPTDKERILSLSSYFDKMYKDRRMVS